MADDLFIPQLDPITTYNDTDLVVVEVNPGGTPETNYMAAADFTANYNKRHHYQISRTAPSSNLLVELKDSDGNNPTSNKPLNLDINGTMRKLTSALSVQVNAAANTWNLGATEFAGLPQELFVYAGWRASTSTVFMALSRMSHVKDFGDFSGTATNERYAAYSGAAPASTDQVTVLGRVNVQNTGVGLGYIWTVPAANVIISRPIYETSWLDWVPTLTGFSSNPPTNVCRYHMSMSTMEFFVRQLTDGTSNLTTFTASLPFTARTITNMAWGGAGVVSDNGTLQTTPGVIRILSAATVMDVYKTFTPGSAFTAAGGKRLAQMNVASYEIG